MGLQQFCRVARRNFYRSSRLSSPAAPLAVTRQPLVTIGSFGGRVRISRVFGANSGRPARFEEQRAERGDKFGATRPRGARVGECFSCLRAEGFVFGANAPLRGVVDVNVAR